jgi:hypothetical protein
VNAIVPARFVPLVEVTLVNLTETVQLAPGAMAAPVQLSGPANAPFEKKNVSADPPLAATAVTETCDPPAAALFVSVTNPVPLATPVASVMVGAEMATAARPVTPVPVSVTGVGVTAAPV